MTFMENAKSLELEFKDGTIKILSLEGMSVEHKRQWRDWASKAITWDTPLIGWSIN